MSFRWEDIDHRLVTLRLVGLSKEMNRLISADESRIRFEQRGNLNRGAVRSLILQMQQNRANEWAQKTYEIYCDVWQKQGNAKSAAFLRAVSVRGIQPVLRARANAIASEFRRFAGSTAFPKTLKQAHLQSLDRKMREIESDWQRQLEIGARECEIAERATQSQPALTNEQQRPVQDPESLCIALRTSDKVPAPTPKKVPKALLLKYRSGIKRAILAALTKNPAATDAEVCRLLDEDGGEELPDGWANGKENRLFFNAYANPRTRHSVEIAISKIRRDLRDRGLLE